MPSHILQTAQSGLFKRLGLIWVSRCHHGKIVSLAHWRVSNIGRFDIYSFGFDTAEDEAGMLKSAGLINEFINHEVVVNGIDPSRIVLGGFSQGGTMSLLAGLTGPHRVAGLVVLSGWLPLRDKFKAVGVSWLRPNHR